MSSAYNGSSAGSVVLAYTVPDDSDPNPKAADVRVPIEGLADDVARLAAGKIANVASLVRVLTFEVAEADVDNTTRVWVGGYAGTWTQGQNLLSHIYTRLRLPHGATLDGFEVYVTGAAGHAALPANLPRVYLSRVAHSTGAVTTLQNVGDGSATTGAYQARHKIDQNGIGEVIDNTAYAYVLALRSEQGANYVDGLIVDSIKITLTGVAAHDLGAGS